MVIYENVIDHHIGKRDVVNDRVIILLEVIYQYTGNV
jgi:hypothetical protein